MTEQESLEVVAKTVDEAIEIALKELDADRDEVEVEVLSKGRPGFLGFGADPARVRVTRTGGTRIGTTAVQTKAEAEAVGSELPSLAHDVANDLLRLLGVNAQAYLREEEQLGGTLVEVEGEDAGLLIGRRGETLQALEFMVNLILSRRVQQQARVPLDVEGYRERRYRSLRNLAHRMAERVANTGRSVTLNPMSPAERRVIHLALANHPRVLTESIGEGANRKVTIQVRRGS